MKANCNCFNQSQAEKTDYESQIKFNVVKTILYAKSNTFWQELVAALLRGNELQVQL
jgi:hypothetical protein